MSGETDKATGRIKQAAGDLTGNEDLEQEGEREETAGKAKDKIGELQDKANDAVDSVKDKLN